MTPKNCHIVLCTIRRMNFRHIHQLRAGFFHILRCNTLDTMKKIPIQKICDTIPVIQVILFIYVLLQLTLAFLADANYCIAFIVLL